MNKTACKIGALTVAILLGGFLLLRPRPASAQAQRQDVIHIGITELSLSPLKIAVADFRPATAETAPLLQVFNSVLWNDLSNSGVFEMVSKSFYPKTLPGRREELAAPGALKAWSGPPVNAQALAFGNAYLVNKVLVVEGFLYDPANDQHPEILARRYTDQPNEAAARMIAHRFADAIIEKLGGGIPGIAESKIYYCHSSRPGTKDIWVMDYDGSNQHFLTDYGSITLSPAPSSDGTRLAFNSYANGTPEIFVLSLESMHRLSFLNPRAANYTPSWSPDGNKIAFSSSISGDPEIYAADADGRNLRRLTNSRGGDIAPVWNPKGGQIAFVSDRSGLPQVYVMDADGSNVHKISEGGGDAVTPAWARNGQVLAFSWTRGFAPGNYNIFLTDIASGRLVQLTFGAGANEHPWFSPDGRHIVFESNRNGGRQIFTMLADGTQVRALTTAGVNTLPVWSAH